MKTFAIINPQSGGGRTGRSAKAIAQRLAEISGPLTVAMTTGPLDATTITRHALNEGFERVVAVGGDGTINEVINGFFHQGAAINPEAELALLTNGTGGDFRKTFGIGQTLDESLDRIANGRAHTIDVGRVKYISAEGKPGERYFANIASFGMSGEVVQRVNKAKLIKRLMGRFAFTLGSLRSLLGYRARPIRLKIDNAFDGLVSISTCAVANGQYFGGGMRVAPDASPDDGMFDVVVIADAPKREVAAAINQIYTGAHVNNPNVRVFRAASVIAAPVEATEETPVFIEADGESPGLLPAVFEVIPKSLKFRY
jgi:YegS/Rv2252/BmrU family lipid kinase